MNNLALAMQRQTLRPTTLREAMDYAEMLAGTDMVPKDYRGRPGNCLVAMQWGQEIGLSPLQSLQNIAVINSRPALWGDAVLALIMAHPDFVAIDEGTRGTGESEEGFCKITRRGREPKEHVFDYGDAKAAKLLTKEGPWITYRSRMLMLRARGFSARDTFPDVLRGIITVEEARDAPPERRAEPRDVPNLAEAEEPDLSPIVAAAGSMREYAAEITGRDVERPAETEEEELPLIKPDGALVALRRSAKGDAPAAVVWTAAAERALGMIETRDLLSRWVEWNAPHFDSIGLRHPDAIAEIRAQVSRRDLELFSRPVDDGAQA